MDITTRKKIRGEFIAASNAICDSKAHDYAGEDLLANFKRMSEIAKQYRINFSNLPEYALFMCLMKIDRIMNLLKDEKTPKNEALNDSFVDLFNYSILAYECYYEEKGKK